MILWTARVPRISNSVFREIAAPMAARICKQTHGVVNM